jgi:hypothetical protein
MGDVVAARCPLNSGGATGSRVVPDSHFVPTLLMAAHFHKETGVALNLTRICFVNKAMMLFTGQS